MIKKSIWQKQLPTILGLGILMIALVIGIVVFTLGDGPGVFAPRATAQTTPKKVKITNITDTSFTISFFTDEATAGFVKYGNEAKQLKSQSSDDRDQLSGSIGNFNMHHITVRGLQPNTKYYYLIGTGSNATFDNNGSPFEITTAKRNGAPTAAKTSYGSVLNTSGGPADGAVVYLTINGVGQMSSLVKNSGSWAVPLSNARTIDGSGYANITDSDQITVQVQGTNEADTATLNTTVANSQPVTNITLATGGTIIEDDLTVSEMDNEETLAENTFDSAQTADEQSDDIFDQMDMDEETTTTDMDASDSAMMDESETASSSSLMDETADTKDASTSAIVDVDGATDQQVQTSQPKIVGKAVANVTINIEVHSDTQITQQITSSSDGSYELDLSQLEENLEPGEHTVTISYTDPDTGETVTKTQTFYVAESDSTLLAQANTEEVPYGSGNPYPIDSSASASPTPSPSPSSTATSSSRTTMPATSSSLPVSGSVGTTLALVIGGIFFCLAGLWSFWIANEYKEATIED